MEKDATETPQSTSTRSVLPSSTIIYEALPYEKRIKYATSRINKLVNDILPLLDARAAAYGCNGNILDGIRDAQQMIQLAPSLSAGYLRSGQLYTMFGYQRRAMNTYKQGIDNVDSEQQKALWKQHHIAEVKSSQKIDIIGTAPYDIVIRIGQYLRLKKRIMLLGVSNTWRKKLFECSSLWSKIDVYKGQWLNAKAASLLKQVGSRVLEVKLLYMGKDIFSEMFISGITSGSFDNIKDLTLIGCFGHDIPDNKDLVNAVTRLSGSLTKLSIHLIDDAETKYAIVPFRVILSACRNLVYFCYQHVGAKCDIKAAGPLTTTCAPKLTYLTLQFTKVEHAAIEDVLCSTPKLRYLTLSGCRSIIAATVAQKNRNIQCFSLQGNHDLRNDDNEEWSADGHQKSDFSPGLHTLDAIIDNPLNFKSLFTTHCSTLETLRMALTTRSVKAQWESFNDAFDEPSALHTLQLICGNNCNWEVISDLLRKMQQLVRLKLSFIGSNHEQDVCDAIISLPKLQDLHILAIDKSDDRLLQLLFQGLAAKRDRSTLKSVLLAQFQDNLSMDVVLDYIPTIRTLRSVTLIYCSSLTEGAINLFCERMQSHPCVNSITFKCLISQVTDTALKYLAGIKGLKHLKLDSLRNITQDGIKVFNGSSVQLEIVNCSGVSHSTQDEAAV
ncbi:hypothetical protein BJV82DRAFT_670841 [Fennellomyces sp. T-0311]|nr:hypothetical protein BJV82DRAFT_670841 [Fennellomyces sp. T-0311]